MPFTHNYYHVHLILNGDYRGLYGLTEHKQVHKNRINIDPDFGWYVNIDSYYDEEPKFRTAQYNLPVMIKSPEVDGNANMSNPAYNFVRDDWNRLTDLMASGNFPESGYRDFIDMGSLVEYLLGNELSMTEEVGNAGNIRSLLAYKDYGGKITMGPVWDFDCGFGYDYLSTHRYFITGYTQYIKKHSFLQRFYDDQTFIARLKGRWNEKYTKIMGITGYIDNASQRIRAAVEKDTERWYTYGNMNQNAGYVTTEYNANYPDAVNNLKSWLNNRISWLNTEISRYNVAPLALDRKPSRNDAASSVRMSGRSLQVRFAQSGKVDIIDLKGAKIRAVRLQNGNHTINIENLPKGMYVVKATSGAWNQSVKMLVR
jgi:hypothetical protein